MQIVASHSQVDRRCMELRLYITLFTEVDATIKGSCVFATPGGRLEHWTSESSSRTPFSPALSPQQQEIAYGGLRRPRLSGLNPVQHLRFRQPLVRKDPSSSLFCII